MGQVFVVTLMILLVATAELEAASLVSEHANLTSNDVTSSSCVGRCGQAFVPSAPCQCNTQCSNFGDCCSDFRGICGISVTDQVLRSLSQELLNLDTNDFSNLINVAIQGRVTGCNPDLAPNRLLTVNAAAFQRTTIARLLPLLGAFVADVNVAETLTAQQLRNQNDFIDAIFATPVMQRAETFLQQNGFPSGRVNFVRNWFDFYSRGTGALGSNGFEHVFLAETRGNDVLGGHGWIWFEEQERRGLLDYRGHRSFISNIGGRGSGIGSTFTWGGRCKPISSFFIGTSPELELALYNVCYHARRNALCPVTLGGTSLQIQTFDITRSGRTFVATAFPRISG